MIYVSTHFSHNNELSVVLGNTIAFNLMSNGIKASPLFGELGVSKRELGQFLTPPPVADFMASLFSKPRKEWRILDAGAGAGALSKALVTKLCSAANLPQSIKITAYEIDASLLPTLRREYLQLQQECDRREVSFAATILNADFVECATEIIRRRLFATDDDAFNAAILNPPYRKINSSSRTRQQLREAGIETSNLYAAFMALASQLLSKSGELVAITPRSFCNGPYFRPFRRLLLQTMSLRRIHVFDSRSAAFSRDSVLQENVIVHALKSSIAARSVVISSSTGEPGSPTRSRKCEYRDVIDPDDPDAFIHLVTDENDLELRNQLSRLSSSLAELGVEVSTGRVVDFRAVEHLRTQQDEQTVPLIRPCHFEGITAKWPASKERKPCAIVASKQTQSLFVPRGYYVLVKRFSAKEERRRIVACVYDPTTLQSDFVGFENHLNYYHGGGAGLEKNVAHGLAVYLNSTLVDRYFRHFSGHTQVNATDLRSIPYPSRKELIGLGRKLRTLSPTQAELDQLVHAEVF
jgi:adenine-specific DNA-methyltransferase